MKSEIKDAKLEKSGSLMVKLLTVTFSLFLFFIILIIGFSFFVSCTLSFQNISTHGTATDLVDEDLTTSPKTDGTFTMNPLK